ncbi:MAG: hypothetical protein RBR43_01660 [Desulfuromonadaceae bacterium]|nr:hypothetical protein [Desulfuromonas sp.]MDY0184571.1 hypothetical protein [Desulfuromonadaceae bacterium]
MFELPEIQTLANGLKLNYSDATKRYYGDYYRICIEVKCALPQEEHGHWHLFKKLEQMGVASSKLDSTKQELLDAFSRMILPYLQRDDFPERFEVAKNENRHWFKA